MAKRKTKRNEDDVRRLALRCAAWAAAAAAWLLVALALATFDPADPPAHAFGVPNDPVSNGAGRIGALVAYKAYLLIGPGAWVLLGGAAFALGAAALRRSFDQMILRSAGLAITALAVSAIFGLAASGAGGSPEGPGGLLALVLNDHLLARFGTPGTALILLVAFWIGAVLAADRWMLRLPRALGVLIVRVTDLRLPRPALATVGLPRWASLRYWMPAAPTRSAAGDGVPVRSSRSRRRRDDTLDEDAGGFAATKSFDEADTEEDEAGDEPVADGAEGRRPRRFDPQTLRAKIAKMPINLAPPAKKTAPPPREVDLSGYEFPPLSLLEEPESDFTDEMEALVRDQAVQLESALQQYRIAGEVVGIDSGPTITLFEVRLAPGTKVSTLSTVSSDLARALGSQNVRIVPNMAGKDTVGIEVPNLKKELVRLKELMTATADSVKKMQLPMFLGKDASGNPLVADLSEMPHMLIAGTTGSGKSVCINAIIMSFLFTRRPDELKLVLVDPKMVELSVFKEIPHLMCPVVTEMSKATAILDWAVTKMDERYELLAEAGVRDIAGYNELGWEEIKARMEPASEAEAARIPKKLPYLVFLIDELADLMITNKEVEGSIVRIAQKARAVGIHLILATQRPQANVVTGLIKSNMPCRVSFKVASGMDSRIVLDSKGGEVLLGQGDMLFLSPRSSKLTRAQGCLVDDSEARRTVKFLKNKARQQFEPQLVQLKSADSAGVDEESARDPLFNEAVRIALESRRGSVSLLQRRLTIGYSRSSRLIEAMAMAGILGDYKGSQAREVLIGAEEWEAMRAQAEADALAGDGDGYEAVGSGATGDVEEEDRIDEPEDEEHELDEGDDGEADEADEDGEDEEDEEDDEDEEYEDVDEEEAEEDEDADEEYEEDEEEDEEGADADEDDDGEEEEEDEGE